MKCRIYINRHIIRANRKNNASQSPIAIRTYKGVTYAKEIILRKDAVLKYDPEHALCSGATAWIECQWEDVEIIK